MFLAAIAGPMCGDEHPELKIPANARNVQRGDQQGAAGVSYELTVPYPATDFLRKLQVDIASAGWHVLDMMWMNPTIPGSTKRGWTSFVDASKPSRKYVHQWASDWKDGKGDVLSYSLGYESPAPANFDAFAPIPPPTNAALNVVGQFIPSSIAAAMHEWALAHPPVITTTDIAPEKPPRPVQHPSGDPRKALRLEVSDLKRAVRPMGSVPAMDGVSYKLHFENRSNADIASLTYEIVFSDLNGRPLSTLNAQDDSPLPAGTERVQDSWSPFDCDASNVKGVTVRVRQGPTTIRFADGTTTVVPPTAK